MTDWIKHDGGPCPVPPETEVYVNGEGYLGAYPLSARYIHWQNVRSYRIVSPQPPASPVKMVPTIVPGPYGRLSVYYLHGELRLSWLDDQGVEKREVLLTAPELRDAARVLTALAEAMEAGE